PGDALTGGGWKIQGSNILNPGELTFPTEIGTIGPDATVELIGNGSITNLKSSLINQGLFAVVDGGATFDRVQNFKTLRVGGDDGVARLTVQGEYFNEDGGLTIVQGKVGGVRSQLNAQRVVSTRGRWSGAGIVKTDLFALFASQLDPGSSPGVFTVDGDYRQDAESTLTIELAGTLPGDQHDVLEVTGDVDLDGELAFAFIDGFEPTRGQQFEFMSVGGDVLGEFADVTIAGLMPGFEFDLSLEDSGAWTMTALNDGVFQPRYAADFDQDGDVDDGDLQVWETHFGVSEGAVPTTGDASGDGETTGSDFLIWQREFGAERPSLATETVVPEPLSVGLLVIGLALGKFISARLTTRDAGKMNWRLSFAPVHRDGFLPAPAAVGHCWAAAKPAGGSPIRHCDRHPAFWLDRSLNMELSCTDRAVDASS
ncbi:MAG: hypothetical protein AAF961_06350, partial [Planctomycetota bacterium]